MRPTFEPPSADSSAAVRSLTIPPDDVRDRPRTLEALVRDPVAFRDWYDVTLPRVYRYLLARVGEAWLAEELTQQTFVEAIRQRRQFDGRSDVVTWLCAIGRNKLVDHYRRSGREAARHARLVAVHGDSPDGSAAFDERDAIHTALAELPQDQRLALIFRYLDQMTVREVAAQLGRSEKATESLLSRGRDAFRQAYGGTI
jgi:RNA polymerase sigma-70 factor (ECF subfamily)